MTMTHQVAYIRITRDLQTAEQMIDEMALALTRLSVTLLEARLETGAKAAVGHSAMMRLTKAQTSATALKGDVLRVHGELLEIAREQMGGDVHEECPPRHGFIAAPAIAA
jgi:hypothetical protein